MSLRTKAIWITALAIAGGRLEAAEALLHPLFAEHAVLQRDRPIDVWGQAAPNDQITVTLASARAIVLHATGAKDATRVRYCWADAPVCTLTDRSGLPATPFEIGSSSSRAAKHEAQSLRRSRANRTQGIRAACPDVGLLQRHVRLVSA